MSLSVILRILIWLLLLGGGLVAGRLLDGHWFVELWSDPAWHLSTALVGGLLLWLVLRASRNTGRTLGRNGREGQLPRLETNRLVTSGIYSCMRHPMHFGLLFLPLSLALIVGSPGFVFIVSPLEILLMIIMIAGLEEAEVKQKFGDAYLEYRQRVPAFSLRPACLKMLLGIPQDRV
jgi:protein-S-isoprenylcysteine O-methyltransferase Ste14